MKKEDLFNIIDDLLQDCYNETIDREDYDLTDKEAELIYNNVELFTLKLKDKITDDYIEDLQEELFNEKQKFNDYLIKQLDEKIEKESK